MTYFMTTLSDGSYMNIPADRMDLKDNMLLVWNGEQLVAAVDISCVMHARIDRKEAKANG